MVYSPFYFGFIPNSSVSVSIFFLNLLVQEE